MEKKKVGWILIDKLGLKSDNHVESSQLMEYCFCNIHVRDVF